MKRSHANTAWPVGLAAAALLVVACGNLAPPPAARVLATRDLGPLPFLPVIQGRDGGYSAGWAGRSVWVFGDTTLAHAAADGNTWRSSTFCATSDRDASDGLSGLDEPVDASGAPGELLPFTPDEQAFNDAHFSPAAQATCTQDCDARWALWPGPLLPDPDGAGSALLFYAKISARPGAFNFSGVGTSLATWADPSARPVRPALAPGAAEPTLLFGADEPAFAAAALVVRGDLIAYACEGGLDSPCILARVPYAQALDRGAWTFYAGGSAWSSDVHDAAYVMNGATMMTVAWNEAIGAYLAVYSAPVSSDVRFRTAPAPEGPWSQARLLFHAEPPVDASDWTYSGLAHDELADERGARQYVSYFRSTGFLQGEMRLVEVRLAQEQ